jgi:hypothetical protein
LMARSTASKSRDTVNKKGPFGPFSSGQLDDLVVS